MEKQKMRYCLLILLAVVSLNLFSQNAGQRNTVLNKTDGPYIFHENNKLKFIRVSEAGLSIEETDKKDQSFVVTSHDGLHSFDVKLRSVTRPDWNYPQPENLMVISDPHGNLDAFISILKAQNVIGDKYEWTFGKNHLVIIGDVFDRGNDVLPIFWLIYKLEEEAHLSGGGLHFVLGNHEEMVLRNDIRYTADKYKYLSGRLDIPYNELWGMDSELGHWLLTRNAVEKIGGNLIVHAGLSTEFSDQKWDIPQLNDTISKYVNKTKDERSVYKDAKFLFGSAGPLWYRGMVKTEEKYNPIADSDVDKILKQYNVSRIYVGHTIFEDVSAFFGQKVIGVNVDNKENMNAGRSRGALMKEGKIYLIFDDPSKTILLQ